MKSKDINWIKVFTIGIFLCLIYFFLMYPQNLKFKNDCNRFEDYEYFNYLGKSSCYKDYEVEKNGFIETIRCHPLTEIDYNNGGLKYIEEFSCRTIKLKR